MHGLTHTSTRFGTAVDDLLGLELRRPREDRWAAILPNTAPGQDPYKLQFFGPAGLDGHRAYATPQAAYRAAQRAGYTEPDSGALQRLSQTPAWAVIYDTPAAPEPCRRPGDARLSAS